MSIFECPNKAVALIRMMQDVLSKKIDEPSVDGVSDSSDRYLLRRMDVMHTQGFNRSQYLFDLIWELHERLKRLEEED